MCIRDRTKRKEELKPEDETIYYQRMAFCFHIRTICREMNGEEVHLCIGGVRSLNEENLYGKKSPEKFKIFIGWRVRVCSNLMLTCDGLTGRLEVMGDTDIYIAALKLFREFNPEQNLRLLENLGRTMISQEQFCQIIGRLRLYQVLQMCIRDSFSSQQRGTDNLQNFVFGSLRMNVPAQPMSSFNYK